LACGYAAGADFHHDQFLSHSISLFSCNVHIVQWNCLITAHMFLHLKNAIPRRNAVLSES
jgi:hypothetical protein